MEVILTGKIVFDKSTDGRFETIVLEQADGLLVDIGYRLDEVYHSIKSVKGTISKAPRTPKIGFEYKISDTPFSEDASEHIENFLRELYGGLNYERDKVTFSGGCPTCGPDYSYESNLTIGGHDLFKIFSGLQGKYAYIKITSV